MSTRRGPSAREGSLLNFALFAACVTLLFAALTDFSEVRAALHQLRRSDLSNPLFNTTAFVGLYGLGALGLALLYCQASRWVRGLALAVSGFAVAAHVALRHVNGVGFTTNEASLLVREFNLLDDAISFFSSSVVLGVFAGFAVAVGIGWTVARHVSRRASLPWLLVPAVAVAGFHHMLETTDATVTEFPLPYRLPLLTIYAVQYQTHFHGEREQPWFPSRNAPIADHVVFVMDESVRGDMLHVNGAPYDTTPYLDSIRDEIFHYGVASAIANLSGGANIAIQSGLRPEEIPDTELRSLTRPSVFAYYEQAGFFTAYINAQDAKPRPPNFMTDRDVAALGQFVDLRRLRPELPEWEVDRNILPLVEQVIRGHERSFTWVLKAGVHFPYAGKYPEDARWEGPIGRPDLDVRRSEVVREYLSALRWTSDGFLAQFVEGLRSLSGERILLVYTADHGQSMFEATSEHPEWGRLVGHGTPGDVPPQQAMVPLMLFAFGPGVRAALSELYAPDLVDRTSAFEIFPSLLRLAGYAPEDLARHYHPDVFDPTADRGRRRFVSGNHFGAGGPLYRPAPYRTAFTWNDFRLEPEAAPERAEP